MLKKKQQKDFNKFLHKIEQKENCFFTSEDRNIGKTFTVNELAFTLQSLGYIVFILTPYKNMEYFAERFISLNKEDYKKLRENVVVIADEARFEMMKDFLDYCKYKKIPIVGYVNFTSNKPKYQIDNLEEFKKEYEYLDFIYKN